MVGYSSRWRKNLTFDDFTWNFQVHRITIPRATSFVNIFLSLLNTVDGEKKHRAARPRPPIHIFPRLFNPPNVSITIWPRRLLCLPGWWRWQRECLWMTSNVRIVWKCWIMWLPHRPRRRPERESVETWKILTLFGLYELNGQTNTQTFHKLLTLKSCCVRLSADHGCKFHWQQFPAPLLGERWKMDKKRVRWRFFSIRCVFPRLTNYLQAINQDSLLFF